MWVCLFVYITLQDLVTMSVVLSLYTHTFVTLVMKSRLYLWDSQPSGGFYCFLSSCEFLGLEIMTSYVLFIQGSWIRIWLYAQIWDALCWLHKGYGKPIPYSLLLLVFRLLIVHIYALCNSTIYTSNRVIFFDATLHASWSFPVDTMSNKQKAILQCVQGSVNMNRVCWLLLILPCDLSSALCAFSLCYQAISEGSCAELNARLPCCDICLYHVTLLCMSKICY